MPGPLKGPWKFWNIDPNYLRLYPVNFSTKLCILMFIILSIWPNFFGPPFYNGKLFGPPPFGNSKLFWPPPSILPSPLPKYLWTLPKQHLFVRWSGDINNNKKSLFPKFQLIPILRFFYCITHCYACFIPSQTLWYGLLWLLWSPVNVPIYS